MYNKRKYGILKRKEKNKSFATQNACKYLSVNKIREICCFFYLHMYVNRIKKSSFPGQSILYIRI